MALSLLAGSVAAQSAVPASRPRVVATAPVAAPAVPAAVTLSVSSNLNTRSPLSFTQLRSKLEEAKRELSAKPVQTAFSDPVAGISIVRLAFYDVDARRVDYVAMTKDSFLTRGAELNLVSTASKPMTVRIIRANGVNTPVAVFDERGKAHLPLMVQYPVERDGRFYETAYYISTHAGLVTPETVNAGRLYVRSTIDAARENLRKLGFAVAPKIADMAERLSIVEHVDHMRFRTEYHPNIYNDVFTLYALNEGQTYRYSVSSAGAGGMIQMIPSTYRMIRDLYPNAGLMPDFVEGMRNHPNAAKAMLLYIQRTYSDLMASPTIAEAVSSGVANEFELMSAGYNSNPARLPGYIKRGGPAWRSLIPRETQIYLQINASMDQYVPIVPRRQ